MCARRWSLSTIAERCLIANIVKSTRYGNNTFSTIGMPDQSSQGNDNSTTGYIWHEQVIHPTQTEVYDGIVIVFVSFLNVLIKITPLHTNTYVQPTHMNSTTRIYYLDRTLWYHHVDPPDFPFPRVSHTRESATSYNHCCLRKWPHWITN